MPKNIASLSPQQHTNNIKSGEKKKTKKRNSGEILPAIPQLRGQD